MAVEIEERIDYPDREEEFVAMQCWEAEEHVNRARATVAFGGTRPTRTDVFIICVPCNMRLSQWKEWNYGD